jgi:hypothetical protein
MPLSDAAVRNAKPRAKPYKLGDSGGLYLQVQPNGSKLWRHKYRQLGIEKKLSIGPYPEISLSEARRSGRWLYVHTGGRRSTAQSASVTARAPGPLPQLPAANTC